MAAPNADFQFTEGHVRILLWMCDTHQEWIDRAANEIMKNGEKPSDNLMRCREGIADLKCWGFRLLEIIEATPDDEDDEEDEFDEDDELGSFPEDLEAEWRFHRGLGRQSQNPVQKLRSWLVSLLR